MFSKQFLRDPFTSGRFCVAVLATTLVVVALTACGGGGGGAPAPSGGGEVTPPIGGNTPTMTVTYTATSMCASGPNLTSTVSQLAANALVPSSCPALPASVLAQANVVVGSGTLNISVTGLPAGFTGGTLATTKVTPSTSSYWDLVPTTTGNASATLRAGSAALSFTTVYNGTIEMNFVGAPSASKTITFTTGADPSVVVCTAPAMLTTANTCISPPAATGYTWNSNIKAWVANVGVRIFNPNFLPVACVNVSDACWIASVANGTVKFVQSDLIPQGLSTEKAIYAYYISTTGAFGNAWVYMPLNVNGVPFSQSLGVNNGGIGFSNVTDSIDWIQGSNQNNGVIIHQLSNGNCFNFKYLVTEGNFVSQSVTCPI